MKLAWLLGFALISASGSAIAANGEAEIGYKAGTLGYSALTTGDNARAIEQLESAQGVSENDPARLINLAIAYYREGRTAEALGLFDKVAKSSQNVDLVVNGGKVMKSQQIALVALQGINGRFAAR